MKYELNIPDEPPANTKLKDIDGVIWSNNDSYSNLWYRDVPNPIGIDWTELLIENGPLEIFQEPDQFEIKSSKSGTNHFVIYINGVWEEFYLSSFDQKVRKCKGNTPELEIKELFE